MKLRVSIHQEMHNKETKPAHGWSPQAATLQFLMKWVCAGHGWCATHFLNRHRLAENARGSNLVVVDVDGDTTLDDFWNTPTALSWCAATYTSFSHTEEAHRFRALFPLGHELTSAAQHKGAYFLVADRLQADLGLESWHDHCGQKPERLWYGNSNALVRFNESDSYELVPGYILNTIEEEEEVEFIKSDITDLDLKRCKWLLKNFIHVTEDGEYEQSEHPNRSGYVQVLSACAGIGKVIFDDWVDWVSRGHHGEKSFNMSERCWKGIGDFGGHQRLYGIAKKQDRDWKLKLPPELQFRAAGTAVGYTEIDPEPIYETKTEDKPMPIEDKPMPINEEIDPEPEKPKEIDPEPEKPKRGRPAMSEDNYANQRIQDVRTVQELLPNIGINLLTGQIEYDNPRTGKKEALQGNDMEIMSTKFSFENGIYIPETRCKNAILFAAKLNQFDPLTQYLDRCVKSALPHPEWDKCGKVFLGNNHILATQALQRLMVGAVARAYNPGCSMSWIPILVGAQGAGKSMFARNLVPDDFFAEVTTPLELLMKEQYRLHTGWVLELPEIDNFFSVKNIENFKNLITTRVDETRKPYASLPEKMRRRFIMIGTTNRSQFLIDATGNRRFIPIEIPPNFNIPFKKLEAERDQLWAAAVKAYRENFQYEYKADEIGKITSYIQEFGDPDPWLETINEHLKSKTEVTTVDILDKCLRIDSLKQDRRLSRRVGDVLTSLGWRRTVINFYVHIKKNRRLNDEERDNYPKDEVKRKTQRVWLRPEDQPIEEDHILTEF